MFGWLIRLIMIPAGVIAGWLVAKDAPNFGIVQMSVALLLIVFVVAVFAFSSRFDSGRTER